MEKSGVSIKHNIDLMTKVFAFMSELSESQITDFLEGKTKLRLDADVDNHIEALINAKVDAGLDRIVKLVEGKLAAVVVSAHAPAFAPAPPESAIQPPPEPKADTPRKNGRRKKGAAVETPEPAPRPKGRRSKTDAVRDAEKEAARAKAENLTNIAAAVSGLSSRDEIAEYVKSNDIKLSTLKSLGNRHFGLANTRHMNFEGLIDGIAGAIS